jgi:hypothetical protein
MNKKPKLTQEKTELIYAFSKRGLTDNTLKIRISEIKNNKITIDKLSYFENKFFKIFTIDDAREFFTACQEEKKKLKQELNEI